ncbi:hypothetical protein C3492_13870 [Streptomyces sp. Ru62]|nr:hypothetical protein C3492_13870 [Streptomyces sp. Ru62]
MTAPCAGSAPLRVVADSGRTRASGHAWWGRGTAAGDERVGRDHRSVLGRPVAGRRGGAGQGDRRAAPGDPVARHARDGGGPAGDHGARVGGVELPARHDRGPPAPHRPRRLLHRPHFSAYELGTWKPDPGLYRQAVRTLGLDPGAVVAVEDSEVGVRSAHDAGLRVHWYRPDRPEESRCSGHVRVFGDMRALPGLLAARV